MGGRARSAARQPASQPADEAKAKATAEQAEAEAKAKAEAEQAEADAKVHAEGDRAEAEAHRGPVQVIDRSGVVEVRASRPTFRRAGLVFGGAEWTPVDLAELTPGQILALLQEPVLTIRHRDEDGVATPMPADIRAGLIEVIAQAIEDDAPTA